MNSDYFKKLQSAVASPLYNKNQAEFEKIQQEYYDESKKIANQKANNTLTEEKYNEALRNLIEKTVLAVGALEATDEIGNYIAKRITELPKHNDIKIKERETTFDYKKSETDIKGENLKIFEDYRDDLKQAIKDGAKGLDDELNDAMSNVKSLGDALKITEVREDIKNLERDLNEGIYSGVKDIASSSDRVVNAFSNLRDVMNDVDV